MKKYVAEYIVIMQKNTPKKNKINVLLLDLIHNDTKMNDFLQSEIFNCREESPIKVWLRAHCNIDYYGNSKKRQLTLQIRDYGNEFVSRINIQKYPFKNRLQDMATFSSMTHTEINRTPLESNSHHNNHSDVSIMSPKKKQRIQNELTNNISNESSVDYRDHPNIRMKRPLIDDVPINNSSPADRNAIIQSHVRAGKDFTATVAHYSY
jgi:hypothetical protein